MFRNSVFSDSEGNKKFVVYDVYRCAVRVPDRPRIMVIIRFEYYLPALLPSSRRRTYSFIAFKLLRARE